METRKQNSMEKVVGNYSEGLKLSNDSVTHKRLTRQQAVTIRLIEVGMRTKIKK